LSVCRNEQLTKLAEARNAFLAFDLDKSDSIDVTELSAIMKTMGMKLTSEELDKMMKSVDEDGSGEIDFKEFCQLLGFEWNDDFDIDIKEIDQRREGKKETKKRPGTGENITEVLTLMGWLFGGLIGWLFGWLVGCLVSDVFALSADMPNRAFLSRDNAFLTLV